MMLGGDPPPTDGRNEAPISAISRICDMLLLSIFADNVTTFLKGTRMESKAGVARLQPALPF